MRFAKIGTRLKAFTLHSVAQTKVQICAHQYIRHLSSFWATSITISSSPKCYQLVTRQQEMEALDWPPPRLPTGPLSGEAPVAKAAGIRRGEQVSVAVNRRADVGHRDERTKTTKAKATTVPRGRRNLPPGPEMSATPFDLYSARSSSFVVMSAYGTTKNATLYRLYPIP